MAVAPHATGLGLLGGPAVGLGFVAGRAGMAGIQEFADFEQAIRRMEIVQQQAGASPEQIGQLQRQARELGRATIFSATETAQAMATLSQKGFDALQVYQQMPAVLNLAAAGQIEIAEAADIAASAMRVFGMDAKDTMQVADVLTTAFLKSSAEVKDIGVALRYVGPAAKQAGKDLAETVAGIMLLRNAGMTPSMSGTGLSRFLTFLTEPKKRAMLERRGIFPVDAGGNIRSLPDILGQAGAAMGRMSPADRLAFQHEVFGFRGGPAFGAMLQQGAPEASRQMAELQNSVGASAKVAAHELENLNSQFELFKDELKELGIVVGETLKPVIVELLKGIKGGVGGVRDFIEVLRFLSGMEPTPKGDAPRPEPLPGRAGPAGDADTFDARGPKGRPFWHYMPQFFAPRAVGWAAGQAKGMVDDFRMGERAEVEIGEAHRGLAAAAERRRFRNRTPIHRLIDNYRRDPEGFGRGARTALGTAVPAVPVGHAFLGLAEQIGLDRGAVRDAMPGFMRDQFWNWHRAERERGRNALPDFLDAVQGRIGREQTRLGVASGVQRGAGLLGALWASGALPGGMGLLGGALALGAGGAATSVAAPEAVTKLLSALSGDRSGKGFQPAFMGLEEMHRAIQQQVGTRKPKDETSEKIKDNTKNAADTLLDILNVVKDGFTAKAG